MKIGVIGAGIGGLAVATRLASQGHSVTVYEKNDQVGGKMSLIRKDGFTWDGGPSFFTDPDELLRLFRECGREPSDYFSYYELDEACRYMYLDRVVQGYDSPDKLAYELEHAFGEPAVNTLRFFDAVKKIYETAGTSFINAPLSARSLLNLRTLGTVLRLPSGSLTGSMHAMHRRFFCSPDVIQFFDRFATYVGADPRRAPGLLMCMPYLEHVQGAVQPKGGMRAIVTAVSQLAKDCGVSMRTSSEISEVVTDKGAICGIRANDKFHECDVLVNAGDIANMYRLLDDGRYKRHVLREHSLSAHVLYLGIKTFNTPQYLHTILFSDNYQKEGDALWRHRVAYHDPTIYINNTSYLEASHAPRGHENWFVMVNLPYGAHEDLTTQSRQFVMKKLSRYFKTDIEKHIVVEAQPLTPMAISKKYASYKGSIYGIAANSIRGAYLRPSNKDGKVKNLYHVGVTVHPGGGIPLALRSARLVSGMIGGVHD